jgi:hypothetical protein
VRHLSSSHGVTVNSASVSYNISHIFTRAYSRPDLTRWRHVLDSVRHCEHGSVTARVNTDSAWFPCRFFYLLLFLLARLHPTRARASYRPVGLALWDSCGELLPTSLLPTARGVPKWSPIQVLTTPNVRAVLYAGSGLTTGWSPEHGIVPTV